jgi:uncharacterized protein YkwD
VRGIAVVVAGLGLALGACAARGVLPPAASQRSGPAARGAPDGAPTAQTTELGAPITFAPAGRAAARYNDAPPDDPPTPLGNAVAAAIRAAALHTGLAAPRPDARLFRACADLAALVPEHRLVVATLESPVIEFALQRQGIIEPEARLLFGWGNAATPDDFMAELRPKLVGLLRDGEPVRFGVGVAQRKPDGTAAIVFALQGSRISTLPIPRAVVARGELAIDAVLDPRYRDPDVFVTRDDGITERLQVVPGRPGGFVAQLVCDRSGRQQLEITASDQTGATVLANFPVWCGTDPPLSLAVELVAEDASDSAEQAERYLLASINRDRAAAGLPELVWDGAVAAVAREYSEEMHRRGAVAHVSPVSGTAVDRLRAARIDSRIVLENVARAYGLHEAHRALMNSPGHRANLMSSEATQIGIGVVLGDEAEGRRELFITELMTRALRMAE